MSSRQRSVLVVDDNDEMCGFLRDVLADSNYDVKVAGSATDALHFVRDRAFDVALVDLVLSGTVAGEHLAGMLARLGCRVVMMSGLINAKERLSLLPYPFVVKPFRLPALLSLLEEAFNAGPRADDRPRHLKPLSGRSPDTMEQTSMLSALRRRP